MAPIFIRHLFIAVAVSIVAIPELISASVPKTNVGYSPASFSNQELYGSTNDDQLFRYTLLSGHHGSNEGENLNKYKEVGPCTNGFISSKTLITENDIPQDKQSCYWQFLSPPDQDLRVSIKNLTLPSEISPENGCADQWIEIVGARQDRTRITLCGSITSHQEIDPIIAENEMVAIYVTTSMQYTDNTIELEIDFVDRNEAANCSSGYVEQDSGCIDINECLLGFCHPWADCVNMDGGYECSCKDGFNGTGFDCEPIKGCPDGWVTYPGASSCYKFVNTTKTWASASDDCFKNLSRLVCMNDEAELDFYGQLTYGPSWTGLHDTELEWKFICEDEMEGLARRPWRYYEGYAPSGTTYNCIYTIYPMRWGVADCNTTDLNIFTACRLKNSPCPSGWTQFLPGYCVLFSDVSRTYDEARDFCKEQALGADVLTFDSLLENEELSTRTNAARWLGYRKKMGSDTWEAVDPDNDTNFRNWISPDDVQLSSINYSGYDMCAVMSGVQYIDGDCAGSRMYTCEKDINL